MPLNKLENFIKNTDGRTLYVNPADLNATDSITNEGTSLTEPFRTVQRALLEAARFSYQRGDDNDLIEKTTIMLYPGEHTIDNRPGYGIKLDGDDPIAVSPTGAEIADPGAFFNLTSDTNFDIESADNVLWHFNSIFGGVIVPRGTSIVGMDLRKTKIRPLYVPNPTDPSVPDSAIFRVTGACYFWQFTIFDGKDGVPVYTSNIDYSDNNKSLPTFSHHKLTAFEYADGVNVAAANGFQLTDLAMYYSKLSNAYNEASGRDIDEKYPQEPGGFSPQRPEFEIVGAFATDPVNISNIISGDGFVADAVVTVTTATDHGLDIDTPIKIRGVAVVDYNVSTKVSAVINEKTFTYVLPFVRTNLPARPSTASANVTVETDTVQGASPYIFNVSMRSVYGINGMHADGAKATGFRSMVVAQFTAISLQKDDRAFVKYNEQARTYDGINVSEVVRGAELSSQSSSTNTSTVYHLDPRAVYRPGWDTTHIKMSNDAVIQIVSVFAIGFNQHFAALSGADASITNSNSNFGQFALLSGGFKKQAFTKDDEGFVTQIITPRTAFNPETDEVEDIEWVNLDFAATASAQLSQHIYLLGFTNQEAFPPSITQGYRIGANTNEILYQRLEDGTSVTAQVLMTDEPTSSTSQSGDSIGLKEYPVIGTPQNSTLTLPPHKLLQGEKVRIFSSIGDLPENIQQNTLYYANVVSSEEIRLATSEANALNGIFLDIYGGSQLRIESRVNDKSAGDPGHPVQYDTLRGQWFVHVAENSDLYNYIRNNSNSEEGVDNISLVKRKSDDRGLNDKLYRLRYVIPRTSTNAKPPTSGYVLQYSSSTGARNNDDFGLTEITQNDYDYKRNPRWILDCILNTPTQEIIVDCAIPHELSPGDTVNILNVVSSNNPEGSNTLGFNGTFTVTRIDGSRRFRYSQTDDDGFFRNPGVFENNINDRNILLPRFERNDIQSNIFIYRVETIVEFRQGIRDGIYHLFVLNGGNRVSGTFNDRKYNQPIEYLYPQQDRDNISDNPPSTKSFAKRAPLGDVTIDEPQYSLTRETSDKLIASLNRGRIASIVEATNYFQLTFEREHQYNGVFGYTTLNGGSGYVNGTYYSVRLLSGGASWKGASATVVVQSNRVTQVTITDPGSFYGPETLDIDSAPLGGGTGASIVIDANCISNNVNTVVQVTGAGDSVDTFYSYITEVVNTSTIRIARRVGETPTPVPGMFAVPVDSGTPVGSTTFSDGRTTFNRSGDISFGLQRGNSFVAFDNARRFLGKFYVGDVPDTSSITAITETQLSNVALVGKCGLEDNDAPTGSTGENIGVRGAFYFGNSTFYVASSSTGTNNTFSVGAKEGGITGFVEQKLPLGTYIQVGSEIMRISSSSFGGTNNNEVLVLRGALGTNISNHIQGTKIRVIEPQPIELRRPSILRASGHTFEYLGYGPGNYSTALPQLQVEQLPDNEVYLVQAQELSCGQVVYTGMSDSGDFYIGNIKYSATSGTQITFDVPVPTIAGEDASSNNVTFDEVTITRRLFVQGGETNEVQSQFDGPVKFTQPVNIKSDLNITGSTVVNDLEVQSERNATSSTSNAALKVAGGVAIGKDLYIGGRFSADIIIAQDRVESPRVNTDRIEAYTSNTTSPLLYNSLAEGVDIRLGNFLRFNRFLFRNERDVDSTDVTIATAPVQVEGGLVVKKSIVADRIYGKGISPIGSVIMWGGSTANIPAGYLLCDGSTYSKPTSQGGSNNDYVELFDAIGTIHGENSAQTRFRVPDLRDKFVPGAGGTYAPAATGGEDSVELTEDQLASHTHEISEGDTTHSHPDNTQSTETESISHSHTGNAALNGNHSHESGSATNPGVSGIGGNHNHGGSTTENGGHRHRYDKPDGGKEFGNRTQSAADNQYSEQDTSREGVHEHEIATDFHEGHRHVVRIRSAGEHDHTVEVGDGDNIHSHNITVSTPEETVTHEHTIEPTGTGAGHENRPQFYALCYLIQYQ